MTLESLFTPQSIAVVGASGTPGKVGHEVVRNLLEGGFEGRVVPVNPLRKEILGLEVLPRLDRSIRIDMALVAVPREAAEQSVEDALAAGAKSVVVMTAGFRETGPDGAAREEHLVEMCRSRGARLVGPNCLGIINTDHSMNATFGRGLPPAGGISVVSQSGALMAAMLDMTVEHGIGMSKLASIGNKADVDEADLFTYLAEDEETRVIVAYLESISSGDEFIRAAEAVTSRKPLVVLRSGTSSSGERAASSHTGSLVGADVAYGAAFSRAGVVRVEGFQELLDVANALALQPLPEYGRVAIITNAGGPGIMAADAVERQDLQVASLDSFTSTALKSQLPGAASVGNPIDVLGDADPLRYENALRACIEADSVDAIIVILTPQAMTRPRETARQIASCCSEADKPILSVFMGGRDVTQGRDELVAAGLPDYPTPTRAVRALRAMVDYRSWLRRPERVVTHFPVNRRPVERIIHQHLRIERLQLGEVQAKTILKAYDFTVPEGRLARTGDEAVQVAERQGFPVAMKIVSPDIIHKSDVGGVRIDLPTSEAVQDAYDLMMLRIPRLVPEARIDGVYVERMAKGGLEVILGMSRDPQFGPMLMFGLGGIFVEVMKDVSFHLAPVTADEARQMLESTKSYEMLEGVRGHSGVDISGIAGGLQRISQLVTDFPQIDQLDINPFVVGGPDLEPVVVDARMALRHAVAEEEAPRPGRSKSG